MQTIRQMTGREIAQYMGQDATDAHGDEMRWLLIRGGYGDTTTADIPDAIWETVAREAIKETP